MSDGITDTPMVLNLKRLFSQVDDVQIAQMILEENENVGALAIALVSSQKRIQIINHLPKAKKLGTIKTLATLKQPPDFVLETILEKLKSRFMLR